MTAGAAGKEKKDKKIEEVHSPIKSDDQLSNPAIQSFVEIEKKGRRRRRNSYLIFDEKSAMALINLQQKSMKIQ